MKILFIQDHLFLGGAAKAAQSYRKLCEQNGWKTAVICADSSGQEGVIRINEKKQQTICGKILRVFEHDPLTKLREATRNKIITAARIVQPDLIWIHNISGAFKWGWCPEIIQDLAKQFRIIWTLHDMWALGNGPEYFYEKATAGKKSFLCRLLRGRHTKVLVTTPSMWLRAMTQGNAPPGQKVVFMPYAGLLPTIEKENKKFTKKLLTKKAGKTLFLFVAENLADRRKNLKVIIQALKILKPKEQNKIILGLVGRNTEIIDTAVTASVWKFGAVEDPGALQSIYQAADFLLCPSLQDNSPLVIREALCSGVPVLAAKAGGIPELFRQGRGGWLIAGNSPSLWALKISQLTNHPPLSRPARAYLSRDYRKILTKQDKQIVQQISKIS